MNRSAPCRAQSVATVSAFPWAFLRHDISAATGKWNRDQLFQNLLQQGHLLGCCSISVTEVYAGLRSHEETRTRELLESLMYFPIVWPAARLAGLLKRDYARKGITLATTDATIAAIAIHHQLTLISDNLKHYPLKELSIYPLT